MRTCHRAVLTAVIFSLVQFGLEAAEEPVASAETAAPYKSYYERNKEAAEESVKTAEAAAAAFMWATVYGKPEDTRKYLTNYYFDMLYEQWRPGKGEVRDIEQIIAMVNRDKITTVPLSISTNFTKRDIK